MSVRTVFKAVEKLTVDNAPTIMSGLAITGTLSTAFFTGKATFKAAERIRDEEEARVVHSLDEMTTKDKVQLVWPLYVPPAVAVVSTVAFVVAANHISASRLAGVAAAYKISEKHFEEYSDKVKEKLGLKEEEALVAEIDQSNVDATYTDAISTIGISPIVNGDVVFRDDWSGRYFYSSMAKVKQVENDINAMIMKDGYATLTDFYDGLGLESISESGTIGWSLEKGFGLNFTTALADHGSVPVAVMHFGSRPHFAQDFDRMQ